MRQIKPYKAKISTQKLYLYLDGNNHENNGGIFLFFPSWKNVMVLNVFGNSGNEKNGDSSIEKVMEETCEWIFPLYVIRPLGYQRPKHWPMITRVRR